MELVLTALWEIFLQMVGEILIELGFRSIGESFRRRSRAHPVVAGIGVALLGGLAGVLTSVIWPARLFRPGPLTGASLLVSPLITDEPAGRTRARGTK